MIPTHERVTLTPRTPSNAFAGALLATIADRRACVRVIFVAALMIRLLTLGITFRGNDVVPYYDDAQIALNIVGGHGFSINYDYRNFLLYKSLLSKGELDHPVTTGTRPTAVKQPLNALFLAGLFYVFGPKNFLAVFLIQAVISALTVSLLYVFLSSFAPRLALMAAAAATFYPPFVGHPVTVPESTTLVLFLLVAVFWSVANVRQRQSWIAWLIIGVVAGVTILTEPTTVPFLILCLAYCAYLDRSALKVRVARSILAGTLILAMLTPWVVRNYVVFGTFPVLKTGAFGHVFVWGLKFSGTGSWIPDERIVALEKAGRALNEVQEERAIQDEVVAEFPRHWREYVAYDIPLNLLNLWWDVAEYRNDYSLRYMLGRRLPFLILLCLAVPEIFRLFRRLVRQFVATLDEQPAEVMALMLMATYSAVYGLVGAFHSRYRLPIELALFVFAGTTMASLLSRLRSVRFSASILDSGRS